MVKRLQMEKRKGMGKSDGELTKKRNNTNTCGRDGYEEETMGKRKQHGET